MSYRRPTDRDERPTLPPIRDLFRDELSLSPTPRPAGDSPSIPIAQLGLDDSDRPYSYGPPAGLDARVSSSRDRRAPPPERSVSFDPNYGYPRSLPGPSAPRDPGRGGPMHPTRNPTLPPAGAYSAGHPRPEYASPTPNRDYHYDPRAAPSQARDPGRTAFPESASYPPRPRTTYPPMTGTAGYTPDDRHFGHPHAAVPPPAFEPPAAFMPDEEAMASAARYECTYCGKGFNRPSSLKIHLNSHTGERPFVCPAEGCGRSFSVLSNMRRHARVHSQVLLQHPEASSDETSEPSPPINTSSSSEAHASGSSSSSRHHRSTPSSSSGGSR